MRVRYDTGVEAESERELAIMRNTIHDLIFIFSCWKQRNACGCVNKKYRNRNDKSMTWNNIADAYKLRSNRKNLIINNWSRWKEYVFMIYVGYNSRSII